MYLGENPADGEGLGEACVLLAGRGGVGALPVGIVVVDAFDGEVAGGADGGKEFCETISGNALARHAAIDFDVDGVGGSGRHGAGEIGDVFRFPEVGGELVTDDGVGFVAIETGEEEDGLGDAGAAKFGAFLGAGDGEPGCAGLGERVCAADGAVSVGVAFDDGAELGAAANASRDLAKIFAKLGE